MSFRINSLLRHIGKEVAYEIDVWKNKSEVNRINFIKQRNYCLKSVENNQKTILWKSITRQDATDNKKFWKTVKLHLSDKLKSIKEITLVEDDKIFTQDKKVAEELNSFFSNFKNLKITEYNEKIPCAFHFVEMQSVFCLYLQNGLEFFN